MSLDAAPIRNEEEYDAALREIERLFEAETGTPDEGRLLVLLSLVEAYEDVHYPIEPPDTVEPLSELKSPYETGPRAA